MDAPVTRCPFYRLCSQRGGRGFESPLVHQISKRDLHYFLEIGCFSFSQLTSAPEIPESRTIYNPSQLAYIHKCVLLGRPQGSDQPQETRCLV